MGRWQVMSHCEREQRVALGVEQAFIFNKEWHRYHDQPQVVYKNGVFADCKITYLGHQSMQNLPQSLFPRNMQFYLSFPRMPLPQKIANLFR